MTESTLRAYHGDKAIKAKYVSRVLAHQKADRIVQGIGWERKNGGYHGCAVGCTLEAYDHSRYPVELGVPLMLAHLEDKIFEGLPKAKALTWPTRFLRAIPVGADLSRVGPRLLLLTIQRRKAALKTLKDLDATVRNQVNAALDQVLAVLTTWAETGVVDASAAESAESTARSAASTARSAESAAWSAASAASAARSAESAAWSAAESTARSAESAASAARSAAWSAESTARSAEYEWLADTLLIELRRAPIPSRRGGPRQGA